MSLVSQLMESAGVTYLGENRSYDIQDEQSFIQESTMDMVNSVYESIELFYASDIIGAVSVLTEGADAEVLLEGVVKDTFKKIKDKIVEWFHKLKAAVGKFIQKIKDFFKRVFTKDKVKKAKENLKNAKGDINVKSNGAALLLVDKAMNKAEEIHEKATEVVEDLVEDAKKVAEGGTPDKEADEYYEEFCKKLGIKQINNVSQIVNAAAKEQGKHLNEVLGELQDINLSKSEAENILKDIENASVADIEKVCQSLLSECNKQVDAITKMCDKVSNSDSSTTPGSKTQDALTYLMKAKMIVTSASSILNEVISLCKESSADKARILQSLERLNDINE